VLFDTFWSSESIRARTYQNSIHLRIDRPGYSAQRIASLAVVPHFVAPSSGMLSLLRSRHSWDSRRMNDIRHPSNFSPLTTEQIRELAASIREVLEATSRE
jgi:hypothetical protein